MLQFGYLNRHSSNFLSVRQPHLSRVSSPVSWSMMRTQSFVCAVSALPWKIVISTVHSSGNYFSWSGNLCPWSGNHFSWAGNLCSWIRNLCSGSGNLCSWSGNYFSWAGNLCSWFRNLSSWSGNFCSWSGNYFSWARNLCSWFRNFCPWSGSLNLYLKSFNNQDTFDHNLETFSDILGAYNPFCLFSRSGNFYSRFRNVCSSSQNLLSWSRNFCSSSGNFCSISVVLLLICKPGLSLRAKFNSGRTRKTPFLRCFGSKTLQIRGYFLFQYLGTNIFQYWSICNKWKEWLNNFCD